MSGVIRLPGGGPGGVGGGGGDDDDDIGLGLPPVQVQSRMMQSCGLPRATPPAWPGGSEIMASEEEGASGPNVQCNAPLATPSPHPAHSAGTIEEDERAVASFRHMRPSSGSVPWGESGTQSSAPSTKSQAQARHSIAGARPGWYGKAAAQAAHIAENVEARVQSLQVKHNLQQVSLEKGNKNIMYSGLAALAVNPWPQAVLVTQQCNSPSSPP